MIEGGTRYSFQAFFPSREGWRSIIAQEQATSARHAA